MLIVSTTPLIAEGDIRTGAVLVVRDVTRLTVLEKQLERGKRGQRMVGKSRAMRQIFQLIDDVAQTDSTVLIYGESGTGKELVAEALHFKNHRANMPFIRVNCSALSEDILESELFGHVKGAFTGALKDRAGRFEAANGGTILLDEIGDISPRLQLRLLRVLQEREFERVGDSMPIQVDVRVIASTNQDLLEKIRAGEFREDLYYRLNVIRIELPPLRDRRDDIPVLVEHLCRRFNYAMKKEITGLSPEAMEIVMEYPWYGNIREMENCLEWAFIVCHDTQILPRHLPREILDHGSHNYQGITLSGASRARGAQAKERILEVLTRTDWNIAKSARILGIARNTLYQKMKQHDIARRPD